MKPRVYVCLFLCLFLGGAVLLGTIRSTVDQPSALGSSVSPSLSKLPRNAAPKASPDDTKGRVVNSFGRLPLSFEANRGQTDPRVKFLSRGQGYTLFLTRRGEAVLALRKPAPMRDPRQQAANGPAAGPDFGTSAPSAVVRMSLLGASTTPQLEELEELQGKANYFIGNDPKKWRTNVPLFAKVKYRNIYPGVDLVYYGNQGQLEDDFIVSPGAHPSSITLNFAGVEKLSLDAQGGLVLGVKEGEVRLEKPRIYQEVDGARREISGSYVLKGSEHVGFHVEGYDTGRSLVIDPALFYSTYLGGSGFDAANGMAVDAAGNAYITGLTGSTNFPTTAGAFQTSYCASAFVTKLNPTGSGLVYSTYLGACSGQGGSVGEAIAVDIASNAYVTGGVDSSNFPTTAGAFQTSYGGNGDVFVTKLNPAGSGLVYSTYLGGNGGDVARGVAVDATGSAYVTGDTTSSVAQFGTNFPTTPGAFQPSIAGAPGFQQDAFVTKLNPLGTGLVYSTYLGGSGIENGYGIAVDTAGNAYVTGITDSTDFPTTLGAFQTANAGSPDAYVTKLNPLGTGLVYSTYLGGSNFDWGSRIAVDTAGDAFVTGGTWSTNFPTTPGVFQSSLAGCEDAFVTKLNAVGSGLVYSTYLGGDGCPPGAGYGTNSDAGFGIAVDAGGDAYVTGDTNATDFPTTPDAFQSTNQGGFDAFVTKLNATGSGLVYSSYLGGSNDDFSYGIGLDAMPNPDAYVAGWTSSSNFPTTPGAYQTTFGGGPPFGGQFDAFVAKIANIVLPPGATSGKVTGGGTVNVTGGVANFGFIVQTQSLSGPISGELQYVNHASGAKVHSVMFTTFAITANTATFSSTCTNNGAPCTFNVVVQDNDQTGGLDSFTISINGGPPEGGTLRDGDIEIHNQ